MSSNNAEVTPKESNGSYTVDAIKLKRLEDNIKSSQNLFMGIMGGGAAALVGALAWGGITYATGYQIGWMAVGVGILVGFAVRLFGKGIDLIYGILGAGLSVLGCVLGNIFAACIAVSSQQNIALSEVIGMLNLAAMVEILSITFHPLDLLFYGIAVYEGYRFSFRRLTPDELEGLSV
jgi:hypothetical protein